MTLSMATPVKRSERIEFEGETLAEVIDRLAHNRASGKPKPWAPRLAAFDCKVIQLALEVCQNPTVDEHEARLEKAALHSLGRHRADFYRLMKLRRDKHVKAGGDDAQWIDSLVAGLGDLHERLRGLIIPQARASRQAQIIAQITASVELANGADMDCPKIPREALRELLAWAKEQA